MTSKLKKNSKVIIIITVVIVVLVGGAIYLLSRKTETAEEIVNSVAIVNETINTNDNLNNQSVNLNTNQALNQNTNHIVSATADWLTYTNEEFGYSVKYPTDWKAEMKEFTSIPEGTTYTALYIQDQGEQYGQFIVDPQETWVPFQDGNWDSDVTSALLGGYAATATEYTPADIAEWESDPGIRTGVVIDQGILGWDSSRPIGMVNKNGSGITATILENILYTIQFIDEESVPDGSSFWIRKLGGGDEKPVLSSLDITTGEITDYRTYTYSCYLCMDIITNPENGKIAYFGYSTEEGTSIIISDVQGGEEKVIATGTNKMPGPDSADEAVLDGEFSEDGRYFSYVDHLQSKLYDLQEDQIITLPESFSATAYTPRLSPKGTYVYAFRNYDRNEIQLMKIDDPESIVFMEGDKENAAFSSDENYLVTIRFNYDSETKIKSSIVYLYDPQTAQLVDKKVINYDIPRGFENKGIAWLTDDSFVFLAGEDNSNTIYRAEIIDGQMNLTKLKDRSGKYITSQSLLGIDEDSILLEQMVNDDTYSVYIYHLSGVKSLVLENDETNQIYKGSINGSQYYILGPND